MAQKRNEGQVDCLEKEVGEIKEEMQCLPGMEKTVMDLAQNWGGGGGMASDETRRGGNGEWRGSRQVEMPVFTVENPDGWIFRANRYFVTYGLTEEKKLVTATMSLDEDALSCATIRTVAAYRREFEILATPLKGISEEVMESMFMNGLLLEIQAELRLLQPYGLGHLMEMAPNELKIGI
ncbi:hypothetical protein CK203_076984 [Vitis vinifera]|uniref:Retrotransposon gag domain-containing protein n=1 Tax=Vitis vinifera TaxID=29760 RepID=A0A438DZP0_VITVI|nr:hypothetical protein CK203_076984 [Vitis vinifera]